MQSSSVSSTPPIEQSVFQVVLYRIVIFSIISMGSVLFEMRIAVSKNIAFYTISV
jgi:hypothetical protein